MRDIEAYIGLEHPKKRFPILPVPQDGRLTPPQGRGEMPPIFTEPAPKLPDQGDQNAPTGDKNAPFIAALQGIQKLAQAPAPPPMQLQWMPPQNSVPRFQPIGRYERGGYIPPGGIGIVGDNKYGQRKKEEIAVALPDGGVEIVPVDALHPGQTAGQKYGPLPQVTAAPLPQPIIDAPAGGMPQPTGGRPLGGMPRILTQELPKDVTDTFNRPVLSDVDQVYADRDSVLNNKEKTNPWLNGLFVALQGIEKMFKPNERPIQSLGEVRQAEKLGKAEARIARVEARRKAQQDYEYNKARTATIPIDDENKRLEIESRQTVADQRAKDVALGQIIRLKHYDPNNVAHKRLAERAGIDPEELTGWDDRNPYTKSVAGITYVYDRTDQTFKPSNIPADESATLTDYKVKMPSGEFQTFKVAQKDAARFATQMQVLGAQIEAAAQRQQAGFQQATNMETLRQQGQQTLAKLRSELAENRAMSAAERKKKTDQVKELEILLQAKGEAIPNQ